MLKNRIMKIKILILAVINLTFSLFPGQFFSVSYGQTTPSSIVVDPAGIGAERVARLFTPVYQSKFATTDDTIRWVQIDLGQPPRIEAVKLYPRILPWNYSQSEGFPSHFKIEVSNEPDFRNSVILENRDRIGYPDPVDMVCNFESKEVTGREKTAIWQYPYDRPHCYLITAIEPYLDLYIATGAKKYLDAAMGGWASKDMPVLINGKKAVTGKPVTYVTLLREWKNGDIISFDVPMSFRTTLYRGAEEKYNDSQHYALEYGPFLMAAVKSSNSQNEIRINTKPEQLIKSIKSIPGNPLCFTIKNNEDIEYRPYFEIQDEPFTCYPAISDK